MTHVQIYDHPACCSTGGRGPSADSRLARLAADFAAHVDWLESQGIRVERFKLGQEPGAFTSAGVVKRMLDTLGEELLPVVVVDGRVKSAGVYPSRDELAVWVGLEPPSLSVYTEAVKELVAIGAAIASNCEPCFKFHYDKARRLGVSPEDMLRAVRMAQVVKETPARTVLELAERYLMRAEPQVAGGILMETNSAEASSETDTAGCCGAVEAGGR